MNSKPSLSRTFDVDFGGSNFENFDWVICREWPPCRRGPKKPSDKRPHKQAGLRRYVACHLSMVSESRDEMLGLCGRAKASRQTKRPRCPAQQHACSRRGGARGGVGEVWAGKIAPKFDCHFFDPTCAAGGALSAGLATWWLRSGLVHPWLQKIGVSAPQARKLRKTDNKGCGNWIFG